jgi:hypothetical protein
MRLLGWTWLITVGIVLLFALLVGIYDLWTGHR